jgi:bifunctional ADP-heptose synthase (sugar kinase/adenylyltransferase)
LVAECDAVIVADQVSEPDCGVITQAVRERLADLGQQFPTKILLADSRERIGLFRGVITKPNRSECVRAVGQSTVDEPESQAVERAARQLAEQTRRPVYCTLGERGILYVDRDRVERVPGYGVAGPIDIVGAGDSTTAGIVCALCSGAEPREAAAFGNLVASITIQQVGTTGTATPDQVIARWRAINRNPPMETAPEA